MKSGEKVPFDSFFMSKLSRLLGFASLIPVAVLTQDSIVGIDTVHGHLLDNSVVKTSVSTAPKNVIHRPTESKYDRWGGTETATVVLPSGNTWCLPLNNSDTSLILVDKLFYALPEGRQVQVGDIVVMYDPYDPSRKIMRRVRATNKEWVRYQVGGVEYVTIVPTGKCFVECDPTINDEKQQDSRHFGTIPNSLIIGIACGVIYPFSRFRDLNNAYEEVVVKDKSVEDDEYEIKDDVNER